MRNALRHLLRRLRFCKRKMTKNREKAEWEILGKSLHSQSLPRKKYYGYN